MRRLAVALTVLATLLAGGCGIPDESDVTIDGPGQSSGTSVGDNGVPPVQNTRESTTDEKLFAKYYLQAAAGDPATAVARVKAFLSPAAARRFPDGTDTDMRVVRLLEDPAFTPGNPVIKLRLRPLGTLTANGLLKPEQAPKNFEYKLRVERQQGQDGLFVTAAEPVILLSDVALDDFYQTRTIYFWNKEHTALVPDLRYMPRSVIPVQQPTTVLGWLADGPAPWLDDAVDRLPANTTAPGNVPAISDDGMLQITLSSQAVPQGDAQALSRLRTQVQWSLRPLEVRVLQIKIGQQDAVRFTDSEWLYSNLAYGLADEPERFVIFNRAIRRLADTPHDSDPVPVLKPAANKGIEAAGMSLSNTHTFVAVVTGSGANQRLRVAAAPSAAEADLKEVGELSGALGRPVWAVTRGDLAGAVGLVTRNGRLYSFAADGTPARPIEWPGAPGPVTSVSVAPDGHRVALVSGGRLYRAVLTAGGNGIEMSTPEQLSPSPLTTVAAVAWSSETYLAVAGVRSDGRYTVLDVSADGALFTVRLGDLGTAPVTDLVAYPANPARATRETGSAWAAYMAGGAAWDVLADYNKIVPSQVFGSVAGAPAGATPTAPFFLD
jgi:hypothetical protein